MHKLLTLFSEETFFNRRIILILYFSLVVYGLVNSYGFNSYLYAITILDEVEESFKVHQPE